MSKKSKHILQDASASAPSSARAEGKKSCAKRRRDKKQAEKEILPIHKRPVICPPDKAGRHPAFRLLGYICRTIVIWTATVGLATFVSSALELTVPNTYIMAMSALMVTLFALFCHGRVEAVVASVIALGLAVWKLTTVPRLATDLFWGVLAVYNGFLQRLYRAGYLSYVRFQVGLSTPTAQEELLKIGVGVLIVLFAAVFTFCLVRKVRVIPPAIMSTVHLVVILTFNLYSNRIQTNLGIVLVVSSFAAVLVMSAYDRLYRTKDSQNFDTELKLFEDSDRPIMPEGYRQDSAGKAARKSRKKREPLTVEEELNDYFAAGKRSKRRHKGETPGEAAQRRSDRKALKKQVRAVKQYDRVSEQARCAMGGFMSAAALLVCLLTIALPALFIKGNFSTIEAIDEKMAFARSYVTAVLRGDDKALDELEYQADSDNFQPHSTELTQLNFTGRQIFYLTARYKTNYYLSGWVGTDYNYKEGAWMAADEDTFDSYRSLFGVDDAPAEQIRYNFFHYMKPSLVDDAAYNDNLLTKYKSNLEYGFINVLVHARRVNSPSSLCYFPATYGYQMGVFDYETTDPSRLTYVNYFDGIRTGRKFKDSGVSYATLAYAPIKTNEKWAVNMSSLAASYALQKEALLIYERLPAGDRDADSASASNLTLVTMDTQDGTTIFTYTYRVGKEETVWRFYHATDSVRKQGSDYTVTLPSGSMTIYTSGSRVYDVSLNGCNTENGYNLLYEYEHGMTDALRVELMDALTLDLSYSDFVYKTYTAPGGSATIAELAKNILDQAHTEKTVDVEHVVEDDPETEEDDSYTYTTQEIVNVPVDLSLASVRNLVSDDAFAQRDLLVMNVIDYLITELGCTYTITPDLSSVDPSLDGVDNFLLNTHEGYCVQFASAVALILREYGIPARYVEGYIGTGLNKVSNDFVYGGYIHDYEAHAWVEVYFDGVGWIQYETTPQYYTTMYGATGTGGTIHVDPIIPDTPETETQAESSTTIGDVQETEADTDTENETDDADQAAVLRTTGLTLLILVGIGAMAVALSMFIGKAREAENHRQNLASQVLDDHFGTNTSEEDRREMALELSDAVNNLLSLYGLAPQTGEFREAYAQRLTDELTSPAAGKAASGQQVEDSIPLPDLRRVLEAIAAEEFGHGMTVDDMKLVATLYIRLRRDLKRYIPLAARLRLRYIKRQI